MAQSLGLVSLVVRDYEEALAFFVDTLGFQLLEDSEVPGQGKRWVVVSPPGARESRLLLARAASAEQAARVGDQTGGRVFLFLYTDDFWRDYHAYRAKGVTFVREPREEVYGTVAVFEDLYGNRWDLLQPARHDRGWGADGGPEEGRAVSSRPTGGPRGVPGRPPAGDAEA